MRLEPYLFICWRYNRVLAILGLYVVDPTGRLWAMEVLLIIHFLRLMDIVMISSHRWVEASKVWLRIIRNRSLRLTSLHLYRFLALQHFILSCVAINVLIRLLKVCRMVNWACQYLLGIPCVTHNYLLLGIWDIIIVYFQNLAILIT